MAHLLRIIPDSSLVRGYIPTGANLKDIDQNTFVSINGDDGGTWVPSSHIVIGGNGVAVAGPWRMNGANVTASSPFTFGKGTVDDYWQIPIGHAARTYTIFTYFLESFAAVPTDIAQSVTSTFFVPSGVGDSVSTRSKPRREFASRHRSTSSMVERSPTSSSTSG